MEIGQLPPLETIRVLFREPLVLTLWGIPYDMRPGQSPRDLWKAHHEWTAPRPGHYGSPQVSLGDWIYLGHPGWFGSLPKDRIEAVKAFLERVKEHVPGNDNEWTQLP